MDGSRRKGERWGPPSILSMPTHTLSVPIRAHTRVWHAPTCIACLPSIPSVPPRPSPSPSVPTHACGMPPHASPARRPSRPCPPKPSLPSSVPIPPCALPAHRPPHPCPHAHVACLTSQASWNGPLCLAVMLVAYCRGPWGQGPVPDWTGQSAQATLPCCYTCGLLQRAMGPGSSARLDRPVSMGHSALLLCLWPIVEGHGARVQCQTGQASRNRPLCLVMLVAYHR